jgi:hypothetical protein
MECLAVTGRLLVFGSWFSWFTAPPFNEGLFTELRFKVPLAAVLWFTVGDSTLEDGNKSTA